MTEDLQPGDHVEWNSHDGKKTKESVVEGTIEEELTTPTKVDGHLANAAPGDPTFLVERKDGEIEAHKPSALRKSE